MLQDSSTIKKRHKKFIEEVVKNETVWALKSDEGLASSSSTEYQDENGEPIGIVCFWSNRKLASVCGKKYWQKYEPTEIKLSTFLENWCVGLHSDNWMIGTNFDWNLFGQESAPTELIIEVIQELNKNHKDLQFKKFEGIEDLHSQIKNLRLNKFSA